MAEDIFGDLVEWWFSEHPDEKKGSGNEALIAALRSLGVIRKDETLLSRRIISDWYPATDETYESVVAIDLEGEQSVRTSMIIAHAVTTLGIPIKERTEIWDKRAKRLANAGVNIPERYLIWQGTIYSYYPPHGLIDYLGLYDLDEFETERLVRDLVEILRGLSKLSLRPLGLEHNLRTDGFQIFYCGRLGFDIGESTLERSEVLVREYELNVLPHTPEPFREAYFRLVTSM